MHKNAPDAKNVLNIPAYSQHPTEKGNHVYSLIGAAISHQSEELVNFLKWKRNFIFSDTK